ncbi:hypothetical protein [Reyranella sp.]|uniref:hypothetical protein n=1 Tax=Reyranella sp. TaxID=1929291 RepID=UPI003D096F6D
MKAKRMAVDDYLDLDRKAEALISQKWITLQGAREHVLSHLLPRSRRLTAEEGEDAVRAIHGTETTTPFGGLVAWADQHARSILIRAFSADDLPTRGIEHHAVLGPELHDPVPLVWWHRIVDRAGNTSAGDEYPFHVPLWIEGVIQRRQPGKAHAAPLAVLTNVQVDYARLLVLAKPQARAERFSPSIMADQWLRTNMMRRKQTGQPRDQRTMIVAIGHEFPGISQRDRAQMIQNLPKELKATLGRPPSK